MYNYNKLLIYLKNRMGELVELLKDLIYYFPSTFIIYLRIVANLNSII